MSIYKLKYEDDADQNIRKFFVEKTGKNIQVGDGAAIIFFLLFSVFTASLIGAILIGVTPVDKSGLAIAIGLCLIAAGVLLIVIDVYFFIP